MATLSQCCGTGSLHTGMPTGKEQKVHGLDCYVAEPPSGSSTGIVVILPDAFGWEFPNNRILADEYAKAGFTVYLPEFMNGSSLNPSILSSFRVFKSSGWSTVFSKFVHGLTVAAHGIPFMASCREGVCGPRVYNFFKDLRANEGKDKGIGAAGFCWGGLYVNRLCADTIKTDDGRRLIDCGFTAHPSNLKLPDDMEKIRLPYSIAAAEYDPGISAKMTQSTKEILEAKTAETKAKGIEHEFVFYEKVYHGFAVRNDEDEIFDSEQGKKAEVQAINWFKRWLSKPPPETV